MRALSASQAVVPAFERTRRLLFRPFEWATYLKLAAVACITEGLFGAFNFSSNRSSSSESISLPTAHLAPQTIAILIFCSIVVPGLGLVFYYTVIRLRFAFFHCLVHQTKEIGPAWDLYERQSMRLFIASLLVWAGFLLMVLAVILALAVVVFTVFTLKTPDGKLDPGVFFILFYPCIGLAFTVAMSAISAEVTLHDFILPHMAMEDATFREAWAAARSRIWVDRESFFSYFILRLLLPFVACFALLVAAAIPLLIVSWILSTSATGFRDLFDDATGVSAFLGVFIQMLFVLLGIGIGLLAIFGLGGPVAAWMRYYALFFYGSRYKALGDVLVPPELSGTGESQIS